MVKGIPWEMIKLSKVTAKYQVTIPVNVRKDPGDQKYVLVVDPIETIRTKWRGRFRGGSTTMEYLDDVRGKVN
jgi:bifunctional DNA-binding transcriptional regulator/antitoxin component of YhaV-PrlF toxin-antitoxin module